MKIAKLARLRKKFQTLSPPHMEALPQWMERRIHEDVASSEHIEENTDFQRDHFLYCRIRNSRIRFRHSLKQLTHYRLHVLKHFFAFLSTHYTLPDLDFAIYYGDALDAIPSSLSLPTLVFAKREDAKGPILIPDFEMLEGYETLNQQLDRYVDQSPWEEKRDLSFWRGGTTGGRLTVDNYLTLPRIQLASLSLKYPAYIDARLTGAVQCTPEIPQILSNKGLIGPSVSLSEHFTYKYLIDIDGNTCTYSRLYWILYSNCLPLKQKTPNIQWYYDGLEGVCFFTPETLIEKIKALREDDRFAKDLSERSRAFCKHYLTYSYVINYVLFVLSALCNHAHL